ncbi:MAG: endolytic transglycosylase MltG [Actinomycetaceae bacterium]|nr:endolytic transglycosylase MltG [Actinomycetaceae bacterium]
MTDNNREGTPKPEVSGRRPNFPTRRELRQQREALAAEQARRQSPGGQQVPRKKPTEVPATRAARSDASPMRSASTSTPSPRQTRKTDHPRRDARLETQVTGKQPTQPGRRTLHNDPLTTGTRSRRLEAERKRVRRRRRNAKIRTAVILMSVIALIAFCVYLAWGAISRSTTSAPEEIDYPGPGSGSVEFVVNPGDSGAVIGSNLVAADVVKTQEAFLSAWNDNQAAASILPGTYAMKKQMRAVDALSALLDESNRTSNAATVPPGFTKQQIAERLSAIGEFTTEDVEAALNDADQLGLPPEAEGNAEGWLAPGTYEIHSDDQPADVLRRMVEATIKTLTDLDVPPEQWHEVLTKASILEMEVNIDKYYPMVARVIENRLTETDASTVGLLNMDSTVNYGLGRTGGIPTYADTETDTPYNTYMHKGLPPTPISSPSQKAIEATLKPADGDWLYFVTVNLDSGETKFARTPEEHEENRQELQQWCDANEGKC